MKDGSTENTFRNKEISSISLKQRSLLLFFILFPCITYNLLLLVQCCSALRTN